MNRHVAAVVLVLCLFPSLLCAQSTEPTVNTASVGVQQTFGEAGTAAVRATMRESTNPVDQAGAQRSGFVNPQTHTFGLGGRMGGSTLGFGGSARRWSGDRLGLQLEVSRYRLESDVTAGTVTTFDFAPSVLYALPDRMSDAMWMRPYAGAGANLYRSSQSGYGTTTTTGFQTFGGAELTFPSIPRFAFGADVGYRWTRQPFDGFEIGGLGFSVSAHWYFK